MPPAMWPLSLALLNGLANQLGHIVADGLANVKGEIRIFPLLYFYAAYNHQLMAAAATAFLLLYNEGKFSKWPLKYRSGRVV